MVAIEMGVCECPYEGCGRTLSTRYNLKKHIEAHHLQIRPFKCAQCQRTFAYKHSLRHHYLLHLEIDWDLIQRSHPARAIAVPKLTELVSTWEGKAGEKMLGDGTEVQILPDICPTQRQTGPLPNFFKSVPY